MSKEPQKNTWSYDFSWTQPYVEMQGFGFKTPVEQEMDRIEETDKTVDLMERYPDAEAMIDRLKKDFLED